MNSLTGSVPLTLACHPQTPCQAIRGVDAVMGAAPGNILTLAFVLECDLSRLRIPEPRAPIVSTGGRLVAAHLLRGFRDGGGWTRIS